MNLSNLDLKIELSPSQLSKINSWLEIFYSKCKSRMSDPIVEDGFLKISSADIYNFLSMIEITDENHFDWYRLKKDSQKSSIQLLWSRKRNTLIKNYYREKFDSLENLKWVNI